MLFEAKIQQHYDYLTGEDGHRHPVCDIIGGQPVPKLLVPEIRIVDE